MAEGGVWNSNSSGSELEFTKSSSKQSKSSGRKKKRSSRQSHHKQPNSQTQQNVTESANLGLLKPAVVEPDENEDTPPTYEVAMKTCLDKARQTCNNDVELKKEAESDEHYEECEEELLVSSSDEELGAVDDEDDDDEYLGNGRKALEIDPDEIGDYDGRTTPQNGSQYLYMVIAEKMKQPKVKSVDVNQISRQLKKELVVDPENDDISKQESTLELLEREHRIPPKAWINEKIVEFSKLRSYVEQLQNLLEVKAVSLPMHFIKFPDISHASHWKKFCLGSKFEAIATTSKRKKENDTCQSLTSAYFTDLYQTDPAESGIACSSAASGKISSSAGVDNSNSSVIPSASVDGVPPLMRIMFRMSQKHIHTLIYYNSVWIKNYGFVNKGQGEWLFALLACLAQPLDPTVLSDIRDICKNLIKALRYFMDLKNKSNVQDTVVAKVEPTDDNAKNLIDEKTEDADIYHAEYLNSIFLFIFIVIEYFGQKDLLSDLINSVKIAVETQPKS